MAKCRRALPLGYDPPASAARRFPFAGRPAGSHQPLPRRTQCRSQALRLDHRARQGLGQDAASECVNALASRHLNCLIDNTRHLIHRFNTKCWMNQQHKRSLP